MSLHIDYGVTDDAHTTLPLAPAFGFITILAQKTHSINPLNIRFKPSIKELVDKDSSYPKWVKDTK